MSAVGKGVATASIGKLLTARGLTVNLVKIDPYLNVDAGTMNPIEHGEVFVLDSGLETDQDMGNYERFLGRDLGPDDYMTSGMVYRSVITRERNLGYGGKCVETIPHVRDEVIDRLKHAAKASGSDVSVVEIGGTVGDFQNALFIEAARVMHLEHPSDVLFVIVSYLPVPHTIGEMKTKPTQNAVRMLNSYGVQPDIIIARSTHTLDKKRNWCWFERPIVSGREWHEYTTAFNSSSSDKLNFSIAIEDGLAGKLEIEDLRIEEVGLLNVLRRAGTPLLVRGEKSGSLYVEGHDYAHVTDPDLNFLFDRSSPVITLPAGSHIKPGDNVGLGRDYTIYSLIEGVVKFEPTTNNRRKVSVSAD